MREFDDDINKGLKEQYLVDSMLNGSNASAGVRFTFAVKPKGESKKKPKKTDIENERTQLYSAAKGLLTQRYGYNVSGRTDRVDVLQIVSTIIGYDMGSLNSDIEYLKAFLGFGKPQEILTINRPYIMSREMRAALMRSAIQPEMLPIVSNVPENSHRRSAFLRGG